HMLARRHCLVGVESVLTEQRQQRLERRAEWLRRGGWGPVIFVHHSPPRLPDGLTRVFTFRDDNWDRSVCAGYSHPNRWVARDSRLRAASGVIPKIWAISTEVKSSMMLSRRQATSWGSRWARAARSTSPSASRSSKGSVSCGTTGSDRL